MRLSLPRTVLVAAVVLGTLTPSSSSAGPDTLTGNGPYGSANRIRSLSTVSTERMYEGGPIPGTYPIMDGRLTVSYLDNPPRYTGNVQSWNGTSLATQWELSCFSAPSYNNQDFRDGTGTGVVIYVIESIGGHLRCGPGPWSAQVMDADISTVYEMVIVPYVNGVQSEPAAVQMTGYGVLEDGSSIVFQVSDGVGGCETIFCPTLPEHFPSPIDQSCEAVAPGPYGHWADIDGVSIEITKNDTPTHRSSWGAIKTLYR